MRLSVLLVTACIASSATLNANATDGKPAVLIELFTSEGCSSCPPADLWLQQLDATQPIAGAEIVVLSEHVDYWNHDGWKDPFSLSQSTDRQSGYVRVMGRSTAYTPQVIVNGESELRLSDPQQTRNLLLKEATAAQVPVSIGPVTVEAGAPPTLRTHINVNGLEAKRNGDILAVVALEHARSAVAHGENGGKVLSHVAVAQQFVRLGKLQKGKIFSEDVQINISPSLASRDLRLIVVVQEPGFGKVLGTAVQRNILSSK